MATPNRRVNRSEVVRGATQRPKGWMPPNSMVMDIDLGPDVKVRWVRKFYDGSEEDKTSLFKRMQRGWVIVKPEEVPQLQYLVNRSEEHTSELQSLRHLVCRLLLEKRRL